MTTQKDDFNSNNISEEQIKNVKKYLKYFENYYVNKEDGDLDLSEDEKKETKNIIKELLKNRLKIDKNKNKDFFKWFKDEKEWGLGSRKEKPFIRIIDDFDVDELNKKTSLNDEKQKKDGNKILTVNKGEVYIVLDINEENLDIEFKDDERRKDPYETHTYLQFEAGACSFLDSSLLSNFLKADTTTEAKNDEKVRGKIHFKLEDYESKSFITNYKEDDQGKYKIIKSGEWFAGLKGRTWGKKYNKSIKNTVSVYEKEKNDTWKLWIKII